MQLKRSHSRLRLQKVDSSDAHNKRGSPTVPFARKQTGADIELLVEMDRADEDVLPPLQIA